MRKTIAMLLALLLVAVMLPVTAMAEGSGNWSDIAAKPEGYVVGEDGNVSISTAEGLAWFAKQVGSGVNFAGKTVSLIANIDLSGKNWAPIGTPANNEKGTTSGGHFCGTFDGKNYTISNMKAINDFNYGNGFFFWVEGANAKVCNVTFENAEVARYENHASSGNVYGIVAGYANGAVVFENVTVNNSYISGFGKVGGILGMAANGSGTTTMTNCTVLNTTIKGGYNCGGLLGLAQNQVSLDNCNSGGAAFTLDCGPYTTVELNTYANDGTVVKGTYMHAGAYYVVWGQDYCDYYQAQKGGRLIGANFGADDSYLDGTSHPVTESQVQIIEGIGGTDTAVDIPKDVLNAVATGGKDTVVKLDDSTAVAFTPEAISAIKTSALENTITLVVKSAAASSGKIELNEDQAAAIADKPNAVLVELTMKANGATIYAGGENNGKAAVTIPYTGANASTKVFYIDEGGNLTEMKVTGYTASTVTFETSHFSEYVVTTSSTGTITIIVPSEGGSTTTTPSTDNTKNPGTGANDFVGVAAAMAVVSLLGAAAVIRKK